MIKKNFKKLHVGFGIFFLLPKLTLKWAGSLNKWHTTTQTWGVHLGTRAPVVRQRVTAGPELLQPCLGFPKGQFLLKKALGKTTRFGLGISCTGSESREKRVSLQAGRNVQCFCQWSATACECKGTAQPSETSAPAPCTSLLQQPCRELLSGTANCSYELTSFQKPTDEPQHLTVQKMHSCSKEAWRGIVLCECGW